MKSKELFFKCEAWRVTNTKDDNDDESNNSNKNSNENDTNVVNIIVITILITVTLIVIRMLLIMLKVSFSYFGKYTSSVCTFLETVPLFGGYGSFSPLILSYYWHILVIFIYSFKALIILMIGMMIIMTT